jgi:hypothetical protein
MTMLAIPAQMKQRAIRKVPDAQKKNFSTNSMARGSVWMFVMRPKLQPA